MKAQGPRFPELDAIRGVAVLLMICSNLALDLQQFGLAAIDYSAGFWKWSGRSVAGLFILIAGVSLSLRAARADAPFRAYLLRGLRLFGCGMLVTAATRFIAPDHFVHFGVLHLIGAGTVLAYPLLRYRLPNLIAGSALALSGFLFLEGVRVKTPWLLWLGLRPEGYRSLDYTPLVPWFGLMLLGVFLGTVIFPGGARRFHLDGLLTGRLAGTLAALGRHSLIVYFIHQPVLFALILLLRPA